ncbi:MAG TPA: SET domain-containing protein [Chitinophagaceae bacterium]|nr:SET domain-containing protein [Chitinophagaceae bacterium]
MAFLENHLLIKKSLLPGAGKGLFTKKFIPKGSLITEYKGKITTWKEVRHDNGTNGYIYYVKRNHVIDAAPYKKGFARYANDARGMIRVKGLTNNAAYIEQGLMVIIQSTRDIPAGGEIFVGYGKEYWDTMRENKRLAGNV